MVTLPDDYSQERFNIGVAFSSERGEKQVKVHQILQGNYLIGMVIGNLTKQGNNEL